MNWKCFYRYQKGFSPTFLNNAKWSREHLKHKVIIWDHPNEARHALITCVMWYNKYINDKSQSVIIRCLISNTSFFMVKFVYNMYYIPEQITSSCTVLSTFGYITQSKRRSADDTLIRQLILISSVLRALSVNNIVTLFVNSVAK